MQIFFKVFVVWCVFFVNFVGLIPDFIINYLSDICDMTVREELIEIRRRLAGIFDDREREAVILLIFDYVKGWRRVDIFMNEGKQLSDSAKKNMDAVVDRLILGEPIQYITGKARFYGMDFNVRPGVLIPRPETAELVDWIVDENKKEDLVVLDIGTGSGCIAVALALNLPFAEVEAIDVSKTAIEVAEENAADLKAKVSFKVADMYSLTPDAGYLDIVVSNPPYIAPDEKDDMEVRVRDFEPAEALFVDASDPIRPYKRIEELAKVALKDGGKVYLELNPRFAEDVSTYYKARGWRDVEVRLDSYGKKRMMRAVK